MEENTVIIPADDQPIILTRRMYEFFMANGKLGQDALIYYCHLYFTYWKNSLRREIQANDVYMRRGLGWGINRVKRVKAFLAEHGIIEYCQPRTSKGYWKQRGIILKLTLRYHSNDNPVYYYKEETDGQQQLFEAGGMDSIPPDKLMIPGGTETVLPDKNPSGGTDTVRHDNRVARVRETRDTIIINKFSRNIINSLVSDRNARIVDNFQESDHVLCREVFRGMYLRSQGVATIWTAADGALLKNQLALENMNSQTLIALYWIFFKNECPDVYEFVYERGAGYSFRIFHSQLSKLVTWYGKSKLNQPELFSCPVCDQDFYITSSTTCPGCGCLLEDLEDEDAIEYFKQHRRSQ